MKRKKRSQKRKDRKGEEEEIPMGEEGGEETGSYSGEGGPATQENRTSPSDPTLPQAQEDPREDDPLPLEDPPEAPVLRVKKEAPLPEVRKPKALGYSGRGRPPSGVGMTRRLREVLGMKAHSVEITREYCRIAELDDKKATVLDCLVHSQVHQALTGSAAHLAQIFDRVEGRVPIQADVSLEGKMSITDAVRMLDLGTDSEVLDAEYQVTDE